MTNDEASDAIKLFTDKMAEMQLGQAWAAVTCAFDAAVEMTEPHHLPTVLEHLAEMFQKSLEGQGRTLH